MESGGVPPHSTGALTSIHELRAGGGGSPSIRGDDERFRGRGFRLRGERRGCCGEVTQRSFDLIVEAIAESGSRLIERSNDLCEVDLALIEKARAFHFFRARM